MTLDFDYISGERKSFMQFCSLIIIYMGRQKHVLFVYFMEIGECVCVIVTSELTFDSGGVCCYMGSENKTKRQ